VTDPFFKPELIVLPQDIGTRAQAVGGLSPMPADYNGTPNPQPEPETTDSWLPINLATLSDRPPIQPTLGQAGIAYPGKRHVFSGPQESAKTLAAYAIGLEVIRQGNTIIVIDFEMGKWDARDRLRELGATDHDLNSLHYLEPEEQATTAHIARLLELQPTLVIIDAAAGAYDLQQLDDNKRGDVERFTRIYVRDFWRNGIATIVLDHVVKNTDSRGNYAIGSERKVGGADVHLGFEVIVAIKRGSSGIYKITTHKDRGGFLERGRLADLYLHSDPDTHSISWEFKPAEHVAEGETFRPTILMEKISRYLEEQTGPVTRTTIETDVTGARDYIRKAINALIAEQYASETPAPRGAKLVLSTAPFRHENTTTPESATTSPRRTQTTSPPVPPPTGGRRGGHHEGDVTPPDQTRRGQISEHNPTSEEEQAEIERLLELYGDDPERGPR
jgi:hypothetical protein